MSKGNLFVISGPSGAGKTSLGLKLVNEEASLHFSVSYTTRRPRRVETHGVEYFFVSEDDFKGMVSRGDFLEHALVHGNYYGTSHNHVLSALDSGDDVLLDVDVQGALQIMELRQIPDAVTVFVLPPSRQVLEQRLKKRGLDDVGAIEARLRRAEEEIALFGRYQYVIINDDFKRASLELRSIVQSARASMRSRSAEAEQVLKTFKEIE